MTPADLLIAEQRIKELANPRKAKTFKLTDFSLALATVAKHCEEREELLQLRKKVVLHFVEASDFKAASGYCLAFIDTLAEAERKNFAQAIAKLLTPTHIMGWQAAAQQNNDAKKILALVYLYCTGRNRAKLVINGEEKSGEAIQQLGIQYLESLKGDAFAQNILGYCYEQGYLYGMEMNDPKAIGLFLISAGEKYTPAKYSLGQYYEKYAFTENIPQSKPLMMKWYREAANDGFALAQQWLGAHFQYKMEDYEQAIIWYLKSLEQGDSFEETRGAIVACLVKQPNLLEKNPIFLLDCVEAEAAQNYNSNTIAAKKLLENYTSNNHNNHNNRNNSNSWISGLMNSVSQLMSSSGSFTNSNNNNSNNTTASASNNTHSLANSDSSTDIAGEESGLLNQGQIQRYENHK